MSSTNRGGGRSDRDFYSTPTYCVHRLLDDLDPVLPDVFDDNNVWYEPCVGNGAIVSAVDLWFKRRSMPAPQWVYGDIQPEEPAASWPACIIGDARNVTLEDVAPQRSHDLAMVITNPPFSIADELVEHWLSLNPRILCVLQKLNWYGSARRAPHFQHYKPAVRVLPNRPDFTGKGGDSVEYAWFIYMQLPSVRGTIRMLDVTPKEARE